MKKNWKDQAWDVVLEVAKRSDLSPDALADCLVEARQTIYGEEDETPKNGSRDNGLWEWLKRYREKGTVSEQSEGKNDFNF